MRSSELLLCLSLGLFVSACGKKDTTTHDDAAVTTDGGTVDASATDGATSDLGASSDGATQADMFIANDATADGTVADLGTTNDAEIDAGVADDLGVADAGADSAIDDLGTNADAAMDAASVDMSVADDAGADDLGVMMDASLMPDLGADLGVDAGPVSCDRFHQLVDGVCVEFAQQGYLKSDHTVDNQRLGSTVALSGDGNTLAVATLADSNCNGGVGATYAAGACAASGAVYTFTRVSGVWAAEQYFKPANPITNLAFGRSLALSFDGSTLAVGASGDTSSAAGINGDPTAVSHSYTSSGAVFIFARSAGIWAPTTYIKAPLPTTLAQFGAAIAMSEDGGTLVVGASGESSAATNVNGDQTDTSAPFAGAAYVYRSGDMGWAFNTYLKASNARSRYYFGNAVSVSADGAAIVVGSYREASAAIGVDGDQGDATAGNAGAAYVFREVSGVWAEQSYLKSSNTVANQNFGTSVAISGDANMVVVGATNDSSASTGINGDESAAGDTGAGALHIFRYTMADGWSQEAYVKTAVTRSTMSFGCAVAASYDGNTVVAGASLEYSNATGLNGGAYDTSNPQAGAAYVFIYGMSGWSQLAYVKQSNTAAGSLFGSSVSMSDAADTFAVGAPQENSRSIGVDSTPNRLGTNDGAAYVFAYP